MLKSLCGGSLHFWCGLILKALLFWGLYQGIRVPDFWKLPYDSLHLSDQASGSKQVKPPKSSRTYFPSPASPRCPATSPRNRKLKPSSQPLRPCFPDRLFALKCRPFLVLLWVPDFGAWAHGVPQLAWKLTAEACSRIAAVNKTADLGRLSGS